MKQKFVMQWHITHKCNLRCKHCYQDDYELDMSINDMLKVIEQFKQYVNKNNYRGHINFTGGEPLLRFNDLKKLMDYCEESNISFGILTNGTLITKEIAKELKRYKKLSFIQMSLEGGKRINDNIRGKGTFDKVFKAVKILKRNKIQTMISFTVHKGNYKELNKLILACRLHGVNRFWADRLVPSNNSETEKLKLLSNKEFEQFQNILYINSKIKLGTNVECKRAMQGLMHTDCDAYNCSAGNRLIAILANGDIMLCRRLPVTVGSIHNMRLEELINKARIAREQLEESSENKCNKCILKHRCNNGARCLTYIIKKDFNGKDINCICNSDLS